MRKNYGYCDKLVWFNFFFAYLNLQALLVYCPQIRWFYFSSFFFATFFANFLLPSYKTSMAISHSSSHVSNSINNKHGKKFTTPTTYFGDIKNTHDLIDS